MKETQEMIDLGVMAVELRGAQDKIDEMIALAPVAIAQITKATGMYEHDFAGALKRLHNAKASLYAVDEIHSKMTKLLEKNGVKMADDTTFKKNQVAARTGGGKSR